MVVDGVELLRMIRDDEIEENKTKIIDKSRKKEYIFDGSNIRDEQYFNLLDQHSDSNFIRMRFEILSEEDEEIDIQAIEELSIRPFRGYTNICEYIEEKGNEIIKAIKQLDKKIKNN